MATVAKFTLPGDGFPLGTVFVDLPEVTVQLERVVPDLKGVRPYFWVRGTETDTIVEKFSSHPGIEDIRLVDSVNDEYLMWCRWVAGYETVLDALLAPDIVLLSATGTAAEWTFEIRGESHAAIGEFREYCKDHDIPVTLTELHALEPGAVRDSLTEKQREGLLLAFERGYFDSPREASLEEIAAELDISRQALASRLRRGTRQLVEQGLIDS